VDTKSEALKTQTSAKL
jgi:hypothetical protein